MVDRELLNVIKKYFPKLKEIERQKKAIKSQILKDLLKK